MNLSPRERVLRAFRHEPIDRLPTQVNYTGLTADRLCAHFGVSRAELPARLGNHLLRVDLNHTPRVNADATVSYDWWGAGFDTGEEGYFVRESPLESDPDLDAFAWPNPADPHLLDVAAATLARVGDNFFVAPNFGWALFERAWSLRGFAQFFMDLAGDPVYAGELLDRIADIQVALIKRFIALGVHGGYFGDDYGGQENMLISPKMWRAQIKPRLARMFAPFVEAGLPIAMHSDGRIDKILPDLVEIGLTVYNPVQPEVTDHRWLTRTFDTRLAYYGGLSTQTVLPFGSPSDVRVAVEACVRELAPAGTGLLLAPSHRMMSDIPMANVDAMLAAFAEFGQPLQSSESAQ
ncbi:MAG: uroporphyrinogen decarboxylase family protein [Caldilineaceae bacterium]